MAERVSPPSIRDLFPPDVVVEECVYPQGSPESQLTSGDWSRPDDLERTLLPEERNVVAGAVVKRRREFAAGRLCARRALERLGITGFALLPGDRRAPVWPPGIVGSISHSRNYCAVAVARSGNVSSLGIDIEPAEALEESVWRAVLRDEERTSLAGVMAESRGIWAKAIFSAKECVYKCRFGLNGEWLDFEDVTIDLDPGSGHFLAAIHDKGDPDRMRGRIILGPEWIVTAMIWPGPRD
jgi:4'-phosphopantetheinyl transferase EntD